MPRAGAYLVSDLPEGLTAIACKKCGRYGRYRRETLLPRFGPDAPLPDVLVKLADCAPRSNMYDPVPRIVVVERDETGAGVISAESDNSSVRDG
ncbi:MAG: hypothetical protein ACREEL_08355 [Stellaceae bacterium]